MRLSYFLLLMVVFRLPEAKADAAPKYSESADLRLFNNRKLILKVDSIAAIVLEGTSFSLGKLNSTTEEFWTGPSIEKTENGFEIFNHGNIDAFKVIIFLQGKKYESEILYHYPGNHIYYLEVKNNKLEDVSPLFHENMETYFILLLVTLFTEITIGLIYFNNYKPLRSLKDYLLSFTALNIVTHVALWYAYSHARTPMFFLEIVVFAIESVYWRMYFRAGFLKSLLYSFVTNIASWILGGIVGLSV